MSTWQFYTVAVGWFLVLVLVGGAWIPFRTKPNSTLERLRGAFGISAIAILPSIGGGVALAGCWIGLLRMISKNRNKSTYELLSENAYDLLFIVAISPVIGVTAVAIIFWKASREKKIES